MNSLSAQTLTFLKNFSGINKNILVRAGNTLSTVSEAKNILAFATIEETVDQDFGIYDLNEFLGAVALLENPALTFDTSSVALTSGKSTVKYRFADESILTFPTKKLNMPAADITVEITGETLNLIRKAASALGHAVASIKKENGGITLSVIDPKNPTANTYSIVLLDTTDIAAAFDLQFLIANLKVIPGDYKVKISSKLISHWDHVTEPVEYYIALEKTSTFEA
jgi:hypothetical protein